MAEAELIKLIKISVPTLVVVIVILFILAVFRAKWAANLARKTELETENFRKEMELLAKEKIAQRDDKSPGTIENFDDDKSLSSASPGIPDHEIKKQTEGPGGNKIIRDDTASDGFIEGESLG